ncbi:MAG: hypothetical protein JEZ04_00520 [Spirochaetales bacterium]|nr:hypothetical protein [Spirochaetales bacterium]
MRKIIITAVAVCLTTALSACRENNNRLLERELLFSMQIGKMEDHLYVQQFDGVNTLSKTRIFMQDGFFYIANGESAKVMEFSSFGDLISLYYNEDKNPDPVILNFEKKSDTTVTRAAYKYPLKDPGEVARTSDGELLIDDRIAEMRWEWDAESKVLLDRIVLRFDDEGRLMSYLGQEGPGGTPFPYIQSLHVNSSDEVIVVTRNSDGWRIFWYTEKGDPIYKIDFNKDLLPSAGESGSPSIESIYPDYENRIVYVKVDFYDKDASGNIKFNKSMIFGYDIDNEKYSVNIEIPRNIVKSDQPVIFKDKEHEYLYEFAGVARGPAFFLMSPYKGSIYRLAVLDADGRVKGRGLIDFSEEDIFFRNYYVNPDGILSAVVCGEYDAEVVWWRSDIFIEEQKNDYSKFLPNERN